MAIVGRFLRILRDYCEHTSLVGLGYISNQKIHLIERVFWLICILISAGGSYFLIREYQNAFESEAISLVLEDTTPRDKAQLPSIGVCEQGTPYVLYTHLTDFVKSLAQLKGVDTDSDDLYNVEDFLLRVVFMNMYIAGSLEHYCKSLEDCSECVQCPVSGYKELATMVRQNCSELIVDCYWNGKPFKCCDYFLPLQTSKGQCFIMNTIQTTNRKSPRWFNAEIDSDIGIGELELHLTKPIQLHIQNTEDVPSFLVENHVFDIVTDGMVLDIQLTVQNLINDQNVRDISPEYRKCRFPDENFKNSGYDYYSFTTCVSDCLKKLQLKTCGCISYNYLAHNNDKSPLCDFDGFMCLDREDIMRPSPSIMQPWRSNGLVCKCLPSCNEHEINVFQASYGITLKNTTNRRVKIRQFLATQQFRRQAVRSRLDVVVTIGGILGLFMGASILSGIEIIYFFFIRICNLRN